MADKPQEARPQQESGAQEQAIRQAVQAAQAGSERGGEAMERGARGTAQGLRRSGESGADMLRHGGDAGAAMMRHLGTAAGQAMQRGTETMATEERGFAHGAAQQWEQTSQRLAVSMQETARDMRALFMVPSVSQDGWQDMREGVNSLVEGVMRTNLRMAQEMFRMASPSTMLDLQQRFGAEYLDTLMHSMTTLVRATRRATDEALRPLEERTVQRRAGNGHGDNGQEHGRVADVMATDIRMASPDDTVQHAAQMMREADAGALPVGEGDRLVGMVTDRDVAMRLVAEGRDPRQTRVREVMTPEVRYVFEDEDLDHVADNMAEQQVRRLPVVNRDKRLVGVISLADLARRNRGGRLAGRAYRGITREGGRHTQAAE